jgi:5-oxoprolinase (ATP-hydrolysing) subunit A
MPKHIVDINCDAGESFGAFTVGEDDGVMASATSVNVACGFHGGDPRSMERMVTRAKALGLGVGAHPGFPDLVGFGRRDMRLTPTEIRTDTLYQIGALSAFTQAAGLELQHVKPHGQLNNMAVVDAVYARAIVEAIQDLDRNLILIAYGGELQKAGEELGLRVAHEAYADREYEADGTLVSRRKPGAVIHDVDRIVERALGMIQDQRVTAITGEPVPLRVDTICVHADTPGAAAIAAALRTGLESAGVDVRPLREVMELGA